MQQILKKLLIVYVSALLVLVVSVTASLLIKQEVATQLSEDARTINISGRQRMLSQRIIYLAQDLFNSPDAATRASLLAAVAEFEDAIGLFETSHIALSTDTGLSADVGDLYFGAEAGPTLDARILAYVAAARDLATDPTNRAALDRLKTLEQDGLLRDINAVVFQYERESVARVAAMQRWEWVALLLALGIVAVEIAFVFLPGHRLLDRMADKMESKNVELRRARAALIEKTKALEDSLAQSEHLRREQAEFTYAISHDLKSPTNSIRMLLSEIEVSGTAQLDDEARHMLDMCAVTAARMSEQIEDVLAYSGVTERYVDPEEVDLAVLIDEILDDLAPQIGAKQAEIEIGDMPLFFGQKTQIRLLLQNLLENALKYTPVDRRPHITVTSKVDSASGALRVSVSDNGIGIAPEHHARIFGLFQRLHVRSEHGGSGLGLCTCKRVALNHGGDIHLRSEPGHGSIFTAELYPIDPPTQIEARKAA